MLRRVATFGLAAALAVGFAPTAQTIPGPADETDPIGTLNWLPPNANEKPTGFTIERLIVTYDESNGEDLIAQGPFGVKFSTTALFAPGAIETFPLTMVGHSPLVSSLESGQGAPDGTDDHFMGVAGDVRDGDCANAADGDLSDFSYAYSTTFTILEGDIILDDCQVVEAESTDANGDTWLTVTEYTPGFWIDVDWPADANPLDEPGYAFAEVWYSALYDTDGEDGEFYETADATGHSRSVGGPVHVDYSFTLTATPGGTSAPDCYDWTPQNAPGSVAEELLDLAAEEGKTITVALWNKADWDLFVEDPTGNVGNGGGGFINGEVYKGPFVPGEYTVRGCNFAGEHEVLVTVDIS